MYTLILSRHSLIGVIGAVVSFEHFNYSQWKRQNDKKSHLKIFIDSTNWNRCVLGKKEECSFHHTEIKSFLGAFLNTKTQKRKKHDILIQRMKVTSLNINLEEVVSYTASLIYTKKHWNSQFFKFKKKQ